VDEIEDRICRPAGRGDGKRARLPLAADMAKIISGYRCLAVSGSSIRGIVRLSMRMPAGINRSTRASRQRAALQAVRAAKRIDPL
jgi:hypothetical protein